MKDNDGEYEYDINSKNTNFEEQGMKIMKSLLFFARHSYRDVKRKKCHFCLAFCSVFIVVMFSLVVNTLVTRGPIIFLKVVEGTEGEIDGVLTSSRLQGISRNNQLQTKDNS